VRVVAIDGPAGVGKSTIARRLAEELGWAYLDTGAMYRALTWEALRRAVPLQDARALADLAGELALRLSRDGVVRVAGVDVTGEIRKARVNSAVSDVAGIAEVRRVMVAHQQRFAAENDGVVAEGRDMGTVVFPDAAVKVFLEAAPEERARRRHDQDRGGGGPETDLSAVQAGIEARDRLDRSRAVSPLRPAPDAWRLDTTSLTLDEVYAQVKSQVLSVIRP
jgi:cytidylate kinase